jgi:hypothetical protein
VLLWLSMHNPQRQDHQANDSEDQTQAAMFLLPQGMFHSQYQQEFHIED